MNDGFEYHGRVPREADGELLLDHLARRYRHSSRTEWEAHLEAGRVFLGARPADAETPLRSGQEFVWRRPPWEEPAAPGSFAILFEDRDLLAVAKPSGMPTLPGGGYLARSLLHRVRRHAATAAPLHRLGRWTSGIVLFARTRGSRADLAHQFASRQVGKRYRALAAGVPDAPRFQVQTRIGPVPHPLLGSVHAASADGRPASTEVIVRSRLGTSFLCDVRIATGRPHQIRIHLAAAGHPLVGDPLYRSGGLPASDSRAVPGDPGYHLHAAELTFRHPRTGRPVTVECAPPPRLRVPRP